MRHQLSQTGSESLLLGGIVMTMAAEKMTLCSSSTL